MDSCFNTKPKWRGKSKYCYEVESAILDGAGNGTAFGKFPSVAQAIVLDPAGHQDREDKK